MSKRRGPDNVLQFSRHRAQSGQKKIGSSSVAIVSVGMLVGAALGLCVSLWMEIGLPEQASATTANGTASSLCIANVHDGDTIRTCDGERVRIENIDAPELPSSPKCEDRHRRGWCDYPLAARSRDELASFLATGPVVISRSGTDSYGRTLARLRVNGNDAGEHLVSMGLARAWR